MNASQKESLIALLKAIDEKLPWDCGNKECWQQNNEHDVCHDGRVCAKRRLRAFIDGNPFGEPSPVKSWTQKSGVPTPEEFVRSSKLGRESRHLWGWSGKNIGIMVEGLQERVKELEAAVADPEGTIQRGLNERYRNDMRQRELEHHASWDAEVVVHKMAAARWMRGCVLDLVTDEAVRTAIEALPLVPE